MTYPNSKDTFRRVAGDVDFVEEGDQNNMANTVEGVQDALGLNPEGSETDVKARLTAIEVNSDKVPDKVDKVGDTMTGDLVFDDSSLNSPEIKFKNIQDSDKTYMYTNGGTFNFYFKDNLYFRSSADATIFDYTTASGFRFRCPVTISGDDLTSNREISLTGTDDFVHTTASKGLVLKTPDGTKSYRISIDNSGNVITTLI